VKTIDSKRTKIGIIYDKFVNKSEELKITMRYKRKSTFAKCPLCGKQNTLQISHIIPNFVGKWIKKTGATKFLRKAENPKQRVQDLVKTPMLCNSCEQSIGKFENYFARTIFYQINEKGVPTNIKYDSRLLKYVISQSWRILYNDCYNLGLKDEVFNSNREDIKNCLVEWKRYILQHANWNEINSHYIIIWRKGISELISRQLDLPDGFEPYIRRTVDATFASNDDRTQMFVFCHIPSISIVSAIKPTSFLGFEGAEVFEKGVLMTDQGIQDGLINGLGLLNFIFTRIKEIDSYEWDQNEIQRIGKEAMKNKEKFFSSKTYEMIQERKKRKGTK